MYRRHFGQKKISQNRCKFTPRLTYQIGKSKNRCAAMDNQFQKVSGSFPQSRHTAGNASKTEAAK